jgi:predicted dehydrogenase
MTIGHGGSPNDLTTWKLNAYRAGSGSLLDPGVHMLDLLTQLFTRLTPLCGVAWNGFWKTGIDEELHLIINDEKTKSIRSDDDLDSIEEAL